MWFTNGITARTVIWLAAITTLLQTLPTAACGCTGGEVACRAVRSNGCCCAAEQVLEGHARCTPRPTTGKRLCCNRSPSGQGSNCPCGLNCDCGKANEPKPAAPPTGSNQIDRLASNSLQTVAIVTVDFAQAMQRHQDVFAGATALAALDRCISLCRFTL